MKTTKEKIEVMQAYEEGKTIEIQLIGLNIWQEIRNPYWNWEDNDYRVKPEEPKKPIYYLYESADEGKVCISAEKI